MKGLADVFRSYVLRVVCIKMLEESVEFLISQHSANRNSCCQEFRIIYLSVLMVVDVIHDRFQTFRRGDHCWIIALERALKFIKRNHTGAIRVDFLEGLLKMGDLSFVNHFNEEV